MSLPVDHMKGSKRMSLTERVGRSGREAVVGLSPLRNLEQGRPTGGPCSISSRFHVPSRRGLSVVHLRCVDSVERVHLCSSLMGGDSLKRARAGHFRQRCEWPRYLARSLRVKDNFDT